MKTGDHITISIEGGKGFVDAKFSHWVDGDTIAYTLISEYRQEGHYYTHYKSVVFINGVPV